MSWVTQNPLNIIKGGDNKQGGFTKVKVEIDRIYTVLSGLFSTSGHGHTGSENDGPQIGTGGIANKAITTEKLAPTTVAGYGITDVYDKSTSDWKYAPSGYGLGTGAVLVADYNAITESGLYCGVDAANGVSGVHLGFVWHLQYAEENDSAQILMDYSGGTMYRRSRFGGTWSVWKQLATTDSPVFTGAIKLTHGFDITDYSAVNFGSGASGIAASIRSYRANGDGGGNEGDLHFYTNTGTADGVGNAMERVVISAWGGVGIGTIIPRATLHSTGTTILGCPNNFSISSVSTNGVFAPYYCNNDFYMDVRKVDGTIWRVTLPMTQIG